MDILEPTKQLLSRLAKARPAFFITSDILLIAFAVWFSFFLRFEGVIPKESFEAMKAVIPLAIVFSIPIFYFLKLYDFSWSYVSTTELIALVKAATLSFFFVGLSLYFSRDYHLFQGFPRSTLLISYILTFIFSGGLRFSKRIYLSYLNNGEITGKRTLIVGAGDAGEHLLRSIKSAKNTPYFPVGFADDNKAKQGVMIHGLKVLGEVRDIPKIVKENAIEEIIIALPSADSEDIKIAVEAGRKAGTKEIKIIPSISEIISGEFSIRDLREIQIHDLLGRKTVQIDTKEIESFIGGKKVLITGAAGSIGSELSRQTARFKPSKLFLLDQDETGIFTISEELYSRFSSLDIIPCIADIRDEAKINYIFRTQKPDIVFHAAAYKHVPLMEKQPEESVTNNILGTEILAKAALSEGVEDFIFISTDKSVNPTSVMGATKRVGEMLCQSFNQRNHAKFTSVRFGNVLDSRGSVIPIFRGQIKKGGPVQVTHPDMKRYFMVTSEAVLLVLQAGAMGKGGEVFVLDMGEPVRILDLAREMIRLSGFEPDKDIPIVFTEPRPGEKLFEEILTAEEGTLATRNKKIFMAKFSPVDQGKMENVLRELKLASRNPDRDQIVRIIKTIVPSYRGNGGV